MKTDDLMEVFVSAIEDKIFNEWKHDGFIGGWSSEHIDFDVDGKNYVLRINMRERLDPNNKPRDYTWMNEKE